MAIGAQGGQGFKSLPNLANAGKAKGGAKTTTKTTVPPPPAATTAPAATAPAPAGSPLDSTFIANVAANNAKVSSAVNALNLKGAQGSTALQATLGNIAYAQPRADLAAEQRANAGGGLYSSVYDQNLGTLNQGYTNQRVAAQSNYQNLVNSIASQIAGDESGALGYAGQQAAASTVRAANAAAANPSLVPAPSTPVARTPPPGAPKGAKWAGPNKPAGYHGIGGGWWAPNK